MRDASRDWYPDEFVQPAPESVKPPAQPESLQGELNSILGPLAHTRTGGGIGDDHQTLLEAMENHHRRQQR